MISVTFDTSFLTASVSCNHICFIFCICRKMTTDIWTSSLHMLLLILLMSKCGPVTTCTWKLLINSMNGLCQHLWQPHVSFLRLTIVMYRFLMLFYSDRIVWVINAIWLVAWLSGRTSVFGRHTFSVLRSTCSWRVTTYMGKPSAMGQPTRPT